MEWNLEAFRVIPRQLYIAVYIVSLVAVSAVPVPQTNFGSGTVGAALNGNPETPASTTRLVQQDVRAGRFIQSSPQIQQQQVQSRQNGQTQQRFLGNLFQAPQLPQTNPNHHFANTGAAAGIGGVAAVTGVQCFFNNNCNLNFKPSLGGAIDADGRFKPQIGLTTQVGEGDLATHFTGGLQLDQNSQHGVGTFVGAGVNNGNEGGIGLGAETQFGFSQNQHGQTQAVGQLGGNVQAPSFGGVNFGQQGRPGAIGGAQPHFLGNPFLSGLFQG